MIQKAQASSGEARLTALATAKNQPGLSQGMFDTGVVASTPFDEAVSLTHRVQLLSGNPLARAVAFDGKATSIVGVAAEWFPETPWLQHMNLGSFLKLAPVFANPVENLLAKVTFPILKQWLAFYQTLRGCSQGMTSRTHGSSGSCHLRCRPAL